MRRKTRGGGSATLWTMPWRLLEPACLLVYFLSCKDGGQLKTWSINVSILVRNWMIRM